MKLTLVFEAQTDKEANQLETLHTLLQGQPIGRVATIRGDESAEAEPAPIKDARNTTELDTIARIKDAIERLDDYESRQRVLAWVAQFAVQAGVTVS